jgi:hypothetical protein
MHPTSHRSLFLAALAMCVCSACSAAQRPLPTPAHAGAATRFISSDFTSVIPSGWSDQTNNESAVTAVSVSGTVLMLLIAPSTFTDRVNEHIDVSVIQPAVPEDQLQSYLQSAARAGATKLSTVESFNLDQATGLFITYNLVAGGATNKAQDMVVNHGDSTYDIVLNTSATDFDQQLPALQQVLNRWHWK